MLQPDPELVTIQSLIESQFAALSWPRGGAPDAAGFVSMFRPEAVLIPARRPAVPTTPGAFAERMRSLSERDLAAFSERSAGMIVRRAGNVAIALAGCEMQENGDRVTRDVSGFLLVRDGGGWRIAAQAWDVVADFDLLAA